MMNRVVTVSLLLCVAAALSGCAEKQVELAPPAVEDLRAVIEPKPKPPISILTDPAASDRYNAEVEAWGDRLRAGGMRLCQLFEAQGVAAHCTN